MRSLTATAAFPFPDTATERREPGRRQGPRPCGVVGPWKGGGGEAPGAEGLRWHHICARPRVSVASAAMEPVAAFGSAGVTVERALAVLEHREFNGGAGECSSRERQALGWLQQRRAQGAVARTTAFMAVTPYNKKQQRCHSK